MHEGILRSSVRRIWLGLICVFTAIGTNAQTYNGTSNTGCLTTTGGTIAIEIKNAPPVAGPGTLTFYAAGDLDIVGTEYFDLLDENSNTIGQSVNTSQCGGYGSKTFTIPQSTLASWAADGTIKFTADASASVNVPLCTTLDGCAYVELSYTSKVNGTTAGVRSLVSPVNFCAGTHDIKATIANSGNKQITSLKVNWSINGVTQTPITISNTLDTIGGTGKSDTVLTLGSKSFAQKTTYDIKIWTSDPNGSSDAYANDDTLNITIAPALKGTFTVGGTSPDFAKLTDAVNALNNYGLCGAVTFTIRAGTYSERIVIDEITGASATNTITFDGGSNSSVTLKNSGTSTTNMATILLNGADYVTIKNMRIEANGASYGVGVHFANSADYNTLTDNVISVTAASNTNLQPILGSGDAGSLTTGDAGDYNLIANNTLRGGYYGIRYYGASTTSQGMGNRFVNNDVSDFYTYGMYIYYQNYVEILDNKSYKGTKGSGTYGCYIYYPHNFIIERNVFIGASYNYLYYANYTSPYNSSFSSSFSNNMVVGGSTYGLYFYYGNHMKFQHNSIYVPGGTYGVYGYNASGTDIDMRNNIMANGNGTALYLYNSSLTELDYNIYQGSINISGTVYPDLAAWQLANPKYNQNSLDEKPDFKSATDLHLKTSSSVAPYGLDLGFSDDADGDKRCKLAPTIGADESGTGKGSKPTAGINIPDTIFVGSPVEVLGNQTPNVPHKNLWYLDGKFVKDSTDLLLTISTTGTYSLKVVAQGCSQKDSVTQTVVVVNPTKKPTPDFIASNNLIKPGETIQLTDLTTGGATSWHWEITPTVIYDINGNPVDRYTYTYGDDSSRTPKIRFDEPGGYKVCLTVANSQGSESLCKEKYIRVFPAYRLSGSTAFSNDSAGFIYDNGGPNGNYSANTTTSMLLAPCAAEVYLVINKFELECGDDFLRVFDGDDKSGTPLHCTNNTGGKGPGLTGQSTGTCTGRCYPAKSDTFKAPSGRMYIEMATGAKSSYEGFEAYWWVKPKKVDPPTASFEFPSTICVDIPVKFTNKSTGESVNYFWDLDGDMSQFETISDDASYAYFAPGKYEITLVASNCGGTDTFMQEITVISPNAPGVAFVVDNNNPTTTDVVRFSPNIKECVSEYSWRFTPAAGTGKALFVNGSSKTSESPEVMFTDTGCYSVFLYAKNSGGEDSLELSCFIRVKSPYCIPTVATKVSDLGISEVSLHTLIKKSSQGIDAYQNFVATDAVTLETGVKYELTVKRSTNLNEITRTAWIDWNLDGDFNDSGEKIGEEKNSTTLSWTHSFTVPTSAKTGATVLRVASNQGGLTNLACGKNKYGEYEDYRVYVTPDLTKPVITLTAQDTVYVEQGYSYTDSGATAEDNLDGNITAEIKKTVTPTFDNMIPGIYYFRFNVQDAAGNPADMMTRVVIVTPDKTAPNLIVSGTDTIYVAVGDNSFIEPIASLAEDLVDGDLTSDVVRSGNVDVNKVGVYVLEYMVADFSGNKASMTRIIIVEDKVAPMLSLNSTDTVYHEVNTPYTDDGATASDNYYSSLDSSIIVTGNVDEKHTGIYILTYTVKDPSGNEAVPLQRVVIVRDTKAPLVSLKGDTLITVEVFDKLDDKGVDVSDNYGAAIVTTGGTYYQSFPDGVSKILGDYTVIYTATDSFGNSASITRTVRVVDTEAPTIKLEGPLSANVCRWAQYNDAGYELSDNYWDTTDITVETDGNFINSLEEGVYSLRYRAEDKSGNVAYSDWRIVNVLPAGEGACATGISDPSFDKTISIYPSPTTGRFTVAISGASGKQVELRIVNALGETVKTITNPMMSGVITIDLGAHSSGMYMIYISDGSHASVKRLIVRD